MNIVDIIKKKRDNLILNEKEISYFIKGVVEDTIRDYQVSAFLMAVYFNGLNDNELYYFTKAMIGKGKSDLGDNFLDKHSTGGIGDKLSLILIPIIGSLGINMLKMSGKGLGITGGTVDKLMSIPGFSTNIDNNTLNAEIDKIGVSIIGQSKDLAIADKKLYALRDVTGTVSSIPLIASSIVSKKIASGNKKIVFDVKVGKGAFMKNLKDGILLSERMNALVKSFGGSSVCVLTDMSSPLGHCIGNSLEIIEVIDTLKGKGPNDIKELSEVLGSHLLFLGNRVKTLKEGKNLVKKAIDDGSALNKFRDMVSFQGGDTRVFDDYLFLPKAKHTIIIKSEESGYIEEIDGQVIGEISLLLGGGRLEKKDSIDYGAGVYLPCQVGSYISTGSILGKLHTSKDFNEIEKTSIVEKFTGSFKLSENKVLRKSLILKVITS